MCDQKSNKLLKIERTNDIFYRENWTTFPPFNPYKTVITS